MMKHAWAFSAAAFAIVVVHGESDSDLSATETGLNGRAYIHVPRVNCSNDRNKGSAPCDPTVAILGLTLSTLFLVLWVAFKCYKARPDLCDACCYSPSFTGQQPGKSRENIALSPVQP
jgi:hypothetical protein